jgi:hypothetical protein
MVDGDVAPSENRTEYLRNKRRMNFDIKCPISYPIPIAARTWLFLFSVQATSVIALCESGFVPHI